MCGRVSTSETWATSLSSTVLLRRRVTSNRSRGWCRTRSPVTSIRGIARPRGLAVVVVTDRCASSGITRTCGFRDGENGRDGSEPVLGIAFDGTGYGADGAVWGGELLLATYKGYRRLAHLGYVLLPGGDAGVERPYRMALAHLWHAGLDWESDLAPVAACPPREQSVLLHQMETVSGAWTPPAWGGCSTQSPR